MNIKEEIMDEAKFNIETLKNWHVTIYENRLVWLIRTEDSVAKVEQNTIFFNKIISIEFIEKTSQSQGAFLNFNVKDSEVIRFEVSQDLVSRAKAAKSYIEEIIIEANLNIVHPNKITTNIISTADEIRKFKKLLDDGIINQREFNEKKEQLLGLTSSLSSEPIVTITKTENATSNHETVENKHINELKKIKRLLDGGLINQLEFEERKEKINSDLLIYSNQDGANSKRNVSEERDTKSKLKNSNAIESDNSILKANLIYLFLGGLLLLVLIFKFQDDLSIKINNKTSTIKNIQVSEITAVSGENTPAHYAELARNGKFPRCSGSGEFDKCVQLEKELADRFDAEKYKPNAEKVKVKNEEAERQNMLAIEQARTKKEELERQKLARSNQLAASNGVIAEDQTQARDSPYCEKMKNWASGSIELLAESLGESMSSISLIRFRKGDLSCLAVVDTPKGPVNCVVEKIRTDGKQVYADLERFGGAVCSVLRTGAPNFFVH